MVSCDRKELVIDKMEEKLATITKANGYDYNLHILVGVDWMSPDEMDSAKLPLAFVDSEGLEAYETRGNIPYVVTAELPVWIIIEKLEKRGREDLRKIIRNVKKALYPLSMQYELLRLGYAKKFRLKSCEVDGGWSGAHIIAKMVYEAEYIENPLEEMPT